MNLEEMLIRHEGLRLKPYKCTAGKLTIGVGRNLDDVGITKEEAIAMLRADIARCQMEAEKFPWFKDLGEARQAVVVNMIFNLGISRFKGFKKMIAAIEVGDYETATVNMLNSQWATQVGKRANELAAIMQLGKF